MHFFIGIQSLSTDVTPITDADAAVAAPAEENAVAEAAAATVAAAMAAVLKKAEAAESAALAVETCDVVAVVPSSKAFVADADMRA